MYGDVGEEEGPDHCLSHASSDVQLVLITQTESQIGNGRTNAAIMHLLRGLPSKCCDDAKIVCSAERSGDVEALYNAGANYVMNVVKLTAERVADMLEQYATGLGHGAHFDEAVCRDLDEVLAKEAEGDK